jgi:DNA-nicking Smr family endonuclease
MDFGEILKQWESGGGRTKQTREALQRCIDQYAPSPEDVPPEDAGSSKAEDAEAGNRPSPRKRAIEAELDLHGCTVEEARTRLDGFLRESRSRGLHKVLVIHGKGNHSKGGAVLRRAVWDYLEQHPLAGAMGRPEGRQGGHGAVWVIVRQRSR